jgi:hypothetical protein
MRAEVSEHDVQHIMRMSEVSIPSSFQVGTGQRTYIERNWKAKKRRKNC